MRKLFILCLTLFVTISIIAQNYVVDSVIQSRPVLDGFFGIKFGSSQELVKSTMIKKGFIFNNKSDGTNLLFHKGKFAGREVRDIMFVFHNKQFHTAYVSFVPSLSGDIINLYEIICKEIIDKYFPADLVVERYIYPFEKDDGHYETAIKSGKAKLVSFWEFKAPKNNAKNNRITVMIASDMFVGLIYIDGYLSELAQNAEKEENTKDY